jgi:hypothetical protein
LPQPHGSQKPHQVEWWHEFQHELLHQLDDDACATAPEVIETGAVSRGAIGATTAVDAAAIGRATALPAVVAGRAVGLPTALPATVSVGR